MTTIYLNPGTYTTLASLPVSPGIHPFYIIGGQSSYSHSIKITGDATVAGTISVVPSIGVPLVATLSPGLIASFQQGCLQGGSTSAMMGVIDVTAAGTLTFAFSSAIATSSTLSIVVL